MKDGVAYGFFRYDGERKTLDEAVPIARREAGAPSALELSLYDRSAVPSTSSLVRALESAEPQSILRKAWTHPGTNMVVEARLPGATHKTAADELATICTMLAADNDVFPPDRKFYGAIVYDEGGVYRESQTFGGYTFR